MMLRQSFFPIPNEWHMPKRTLQDEKDDRAQIMPGLRTVFREPKPSNGGGDNERSKMSRTDEAKGAV